MNHDVSVDQLHPRGASHVNADDSQNSELTNQALSDRL
jgi:hypothetical protein